MKNLILFLSVAVFFGFTACSQTEVPDAVKTAFQQKFPTVKKVKWEKEKEGMWEAGFKMDGNKMSVVYDDKGNWLETEKEINAKDLPENIVSAISTEYPDYEIDEAENLETPDFVGYEVEIEKKEGKKEIEMELRISKDGIIILKETEEDDDDD